jgi:hypothetical protein
MTHPSISLLIVILIIFVVLWGKWDFWPNIIFQKSRFQCWKKFIRKVLLGCFVCVCAKITVFGPFSMITSSNHQIKVPDIKKFIHMIFLTRKVHIQCNLLNWVFTCNLYVNEPEQKIFHQWTYYHQEQEFWRCLWIMSQKSLVINFNLLVCVSAVNAPPVLHAFVWKCTVTMSSWMSRSIVINHCKKEGYGRYGDRWWS